MMGEKKCARCGQAKSHDEFFKNKRSRDGLQSYCKTCSLSQRKASYANNRDAQAARQRTRRQANPEKHRAESRAWAAAHPEQIQAAKKAYYAANQDKLRAKAKERHRAHAEENCARARAWRKANPERAKARAKEYRQANKEAIQVGSKEWRAKNRERKAAMDKQYRVERREKLAAYHAEYYRRNPDKVKANAKRAKHKKRAQYRTYNKAYSDRKTSAPGHFTAQEWLALKAHYNDYCLCCGRREPEIILSADHVVPLSRGGSNAIDNIQPLCISCNSQKKTKAVDYRPLFRTQDFQD